LRLSTYARLIGDILDSLHDSGFRRILLCNGHGGNLPAQTQASEWMRDRPGTQVRFYNWWNAPRTYAKVQAIDNVASHASWMENFPWTRLPNLQLPDRQKPMIDVERMRARNPQAIRDCLGDGNFGGSYQKSDEDMIAIWAVAVAETREQIESWTE
jgi:creatinine amidohydrolase